MRLTRLLPVALCGALALAACGTSLQQQVAVGAAAVDTAEVAATNAVKAGVLKPSSPAEKDIDVVLTAANSAVNHANDAVKAGDKNAVAFYLNVLAAAVQDIAKAFAANGIKE